MYCRKDFEDTKAVYSKLIDIKGNSYTYIYTDLLSNIEDNVKKYEDKMSLRKVKRGY